MNRTIARWILALALTACDGTPPPADAGPAMSCASDEDCDDGVFCNGAERCLGVGAAPEADARGCAAPEALPCEGDAERCFELLGRCGTDCDVTRDADGDGVASSDCEGGTDCDDLDPRVYPGATEVCDFAGTDEDCNPETFGEDRDVDGDGHVDRRCFNPRPPGDDRPVARGDDCDDTRPGVAPGNAEECNGLDDDCDGMVDEGVTVARYPDADGDGDGEAGAEAVQVCPDTTGTAATATDCDDTSALFRGAPWFELCDGADNDCDGTVDEDPRAVPWYVDADGDGFGDADGAATISCAPIPDRSLLGTDCDDGRAQVHPGSVEACNGLDDDCNGRLDFRDAAAGFAEDEDGDGIPNRRCHPAGDCDDLDFFSGGAPEICGDRVDNDCDGMVDEEAPPIDWYADLDGDGWGDEAAGVVATQCARLPRASFRVTDCDDSDPSRHPVLADLCDGVDQDCDAAVDEDAGRRAVFRDVDGDGAGVDSEALLVCGPLPAGYADVPRDCAPTDPTVTFRFADMDGDGVGGGEPLMTCGSGVAIGGDCDDRDNTITAGCMELCNGVDDDADGRIDETGAMGCPNAGSTTWTCDAGSCVYGGCVGAALSCDGQSANGCEADVESDPFHCGGCGLACGIGGDCVARACVGTIVDLDVEEQRSCVLRDNGRAVCWGRLPPSQPATTRAEPTPEGILLGASGAVVSDARWLSVSESAWCVGGAPDGVVQCAAYSGTGFGEAGLGASVFMSPMAVAMMSDLVDAELDLYHGCGITTAGGVVCWGRNAYGELGRGTQIDDPTPMAAVGIAGATVIDTDTFHSCAVAGGRVYCWGNPSGGRLGDPSGTPATIPVPVALAVDPVSDPAIDVACANTSTCVLHASGVVECAGSIAFSGVPGFYETRFVTVGTVAGGTAISGGSTHYCVAAPTGAYCFGSDFAAALGNGAGQSDSMVPTAAIGLSSAKLVDTGDTHSCAVTLADEVYCWGLNTSGQLGTRTGPVDVPTRVPGLP